MQKTLGFAGEGYGPCSAPVSEKLYGLSSNWEFLLIRNSAKLCPGRSRVVLIPTRSRMVGKTSIVSRNLSVERFLIISVPEKRKKERIVSSCVNEPWFLSPKRSPIPVPWSEKKITIVLSSIPNSFMIFLISNVYLPSYTPFLTLGFVTKLLT